jgi:hypothetical protein
VQTCKVSVPDSAEPDSLRKVAPNFAKPIERIAGALTHLYADDPALEGKDADEQFKALFDSGLVADFGWSTNTVKRAMKLLQGALT